MTARCYSAAAATLVTAATSTATAAPTSNATATSTTTATGPSGHDRDRNPSFGDYGQVGPDNRDI